MRRLTSRAYARTPMILIAVLGAVTCSLFTSAQGRNAFLASSVQPDDASGVRILQASLAAQTAGPTPLHDTELSGTVEFIAGSDDETVSFTSKAMSTEFSRTDIALSTGALTEIRNVSGSGANGVWSSGDGTWHAMAGHNIMTDPAWWSPIFVIQRFLSDQRLAITCVGAEQRLAHVRAVQVVPSNLSVNAAAQVTHLSQSDLYLDSSSLLPERLEFDIHPDKNALVDIPVVVKFSDYKQVSGITIPMRVQKYISGTLVLDIHVQNASFNSSLTSADFDTH